MSRAAVTYQQVESIANSLYAAGNKDPSSRSLREELSRRAGPGLPIGSPNTIQRHLNTWRERARPVDPPLQAPQLPLQLASEIARALSAAALSARELSEGRLLQAQVELEELAASGEGREAQVEELNQALAARTSERDSMAGQLKVQSAEVERLAPLLRRELNVSEALRLEIAKLLLKSEGAEERMAEVVGQLTTLRAETTSTAGDLAVEKKARSLAERRADVAEARLEITSQTWASAEAQITALQARVQDSELVATRAAAADAAVIELRAQVFMLQRLLEPATGKATVMDQRSGEHDTGAQSGQLREVLPDVDCLDPLTSTRSMFSPASPVLPSAPAT